MKILASPASVIPSPLGPDHLADLEVLGGLKNFGPSLGTYRNNEKLISPSCHFAASFAPRGVLFGVGPDRWPSAIHKSWVLSLPAQRLRCEEFPTRK